ncbi:MAG TPA: tetratricopeptide repeat protein [Elusimicrobiales bacterium]|nr:tetratricopeptide repeat protein [Elusimicrobiales bacterium]
MKLIATFLYLALPCAFCFSRPAAAGDGNQNDYFCEDIKKPFFAPSPVWKGTFSAQRPAAIAAKFSMPKPAGVKRVFVTGESVAQLLGADEWGDRFRRGAAPDGAGGLEIINCGMGGYESFRTAAVLKEVLAYSPDLLLVLSGNNEERVEPCPGPGPELRRRTARLLERFYSLKRGPDAGRREANLVTHEQRLEQMAEAAKAAGVPVVFCTLPANITDMPPHEEMPVHDAAFTAGYQLFYDKDYAGALKQFRLGLAAAPGEPFLNYYLAKTLKMLGQDRGAKAAFLKAAAAGVHVAPAERNAAIRRAAASRGVCVADLEKYFAGISSGGLPGFAEFTDGMHWRPPYNKPVWEEIFRSAGACGIKGFDNIKAGTGKQWAETQRKDAVVRLSYVFSWLYEGGLNDRVLAQLSYIREKAPGLLKKAAVSPAAADRQLKRNFWSWSWRADGHTEKYFPYFLAHLAETERRAGNYAAARALFERALALNPGGGYVRFWRARLLAGPGAGLVPPAPPEFAPPGARGGKP